MNPEDRKTLDWAMKCIIWQRDNMICKKCDRTDTKCVPITEYDKEGYPSYRYYYTTQRIDDLERERGYLALPQKDVLYLETLKILESQLIAERNKEESIKEKERR